MPDATRSQYPKPINASERVVREERCRKKGWSDADHFVSPTDPRPSPIATHVSERRVPETAPAPRVRSPSSPQVQQSPLTRTHPERGVVRSCVLAVITAPPAMACAPGRALALMWGYS